MFSFPPNLSSPAPAALYGRQAGGGYEKQYPADACGVPLGAGPFLPDPCRAFIKYSINESVEMIPILFLLPMGFI
jgi:hypothetical protein